MLYTSIVAPEFKQDYLSEPDFEARYNETKKPENMKNYTVIYRELDGELKEAWYFLPERNLDYLEKQFLEAKKEVIKIVPKTKAYGELCRELEKEK